MKTGLQSSAQETGLISTPRLNPSRDFHLEPINLVISEESHNDSLSWSPFPAYMLSAVIGTRHSYPAVPLARQLVDQWSVHPGPLVASPPVSRSADYIFILPEGEDGGILPIGAVALNGAIHQPMSLRIFQRKSLRGQTKYLVQLLCRLAPRTHIVFVLYEHEKLDELAQVGGA